MNAGQTNENIFDLFRIPAGNPELATAQFRAFSRQLPLMYSILLVNTLFLALTHAGSAPVALTHGVPAGLAIVCGLRLALWWRSRNREVNAERAISEMRRTVLLAPVLGLSFTGWSLSLFGYGNAYQQAHVAFYMAITVIVCIFCLVQLRAAALLVVATVLTPFALFFAISGNAVFIAIAANMVLVTGAMIFVLLNQYRTFAELIEKERLLVERNIETQKLSDANQLLAHRDSLTDLPNRRRFFAELEARLAVSRDTQKEFALGLIDLDGFKPVNDLYGHSTGDRVLIETGRRLTEICGSDVFVARLGGDEFALIVAGDCEEADLNSLGARVCDGLQAPYEVNDVVAQISGSVGFALCGSNPVGAEEIYERADYALYHAKQNMRGSTVIFSNAHLNELYELSRVDQTLRSANLDAEMSIAYQPVFDMQASKIRGAEALARWVSPSLGTVAPALFIKAAERSGLINRLTPILLRKSLEGAQALPPDMRISFNLSARDVCSSETVLRIMSLVRESGIDPKRIDFEITETAILGDFEHACMTLRMLRQMGTRIALDDFGSGFSSLSHVHRLPLDIIKVDRSFIADLEISENSRNIIRSVLDLSRNLGVECVVEGVERESQVEILSKLGVCIMQGFYFGMPSQPYEVMLEAAAVQNVA